MTEYRKMQKQIIYNILSQIKELFPVHTPGNYETICYNDTQEKLYKLFKKYGLVRVMRKYCILDR